VLDHPLSSAVALLCALIGSLPAPAASPSAQSCAHISTAAWELAPARFDDGPMIAQAELVADFDAWISGMRALNPDLSIRADMQQLSQQAEGIRRELTRPMSRREAWLHFARLNPYLRDAHAGIQMPNYREALETHLKAGGHIVPIEVRFAEDGSLRVFTVAPGADAIKPGDRLVSINGHGAKEMVDTMLSVSIGDTPEFQHAFLERRFAMLFWNLYGDTGEYDVVVEAAETRCPTRVRAPGGETLPEALQSQPTARELFDWRVLRGNIGYLRVDGFDGDLKDELAKLSHTAFTAFKERAVRALIIDVRENGGGDDPLWQQDLVDHFTSKPYAQLSHYATRVTKDNADPGDVIGTVQSADYAKRFTPPAVDPIRFNGPVYILDGPYSYSATIQFIVAAQDFGLAKIAGEETAALSCQTGQVRRIELPRTGLSATTPITAYTRPSGQGCRRGVIPDVPITVNEVRPDETLNSLLNWIGANDLPPKSTRPNPPGTQ
jgi:C-terminal processing protease CtpA/Prc